MGQVGDVSGGGIQIAGDCLELLLERCDLFLQLPSALDQALAGDPGPGKRQPSSQTLEKIVTGKIVLVIGNKIKYDFAA